MNKQIKIALAGNPNAGKTSIFNELTGARQKVGNFAGVTVEKRSGQKKYKDYEITFVDLPGTYSLTAQSLDEKVARDFIIEEKPDAVINVIDSGSIERSLFLTTQLIEMGIDVVLALNMWDEIEKSGVKIDVDTLSNLLGCPVIPTVASRAKGIDALLDGVISLFEDKDRTHHHPPVSYGPLVDDQIIELEELLKSTNSAIHDGNVRWLAVKLLEGDIEILQRLSHENADWDKISEKIAECTNHIVSTTRQDPDLTIEEGRYGFVAGIIREVVKKKTLDRMHLSMQIDSVLTHPLLGYPVFLFIMWLIFLSTFNFGQYPMEWIDLGVASLQKMAVSFLPPSALTDLLVDGIIGGVGSVIVFLPNIIILFLGISLLEDSGYMARAAFITDKPMHFLGLHGKSFIPMLMGFGCSVPAIMATRTLESHRDRVLTTLLIPMISCSAKLPVYILFAGAFFGAKGGTVVFSLYILGIVMAIISAKFMNRAVLGEESTPFVMELPPYRWPTAKSIVIHMWERTKLYLKKMGGVILVGSIILWMLGNFPQRQNFSTNYNQQIEQLEKQGDPQNKIVELEKRIAAEELEYSFIGRIGHVVAPVFAPLGYNWQMSVSLLTGFVAKEVVVSTLGVLYQLGDEVDETSETLTSILRNPKTGISPLSAYAFLVFVLLYTACIATVIVIKKELGAKWMWFSIVFQTTIAWVVAFIVYQVGSLLGF